MTFKVAMGADHAGFELKEKIKAQLENEGHFIDDFGSFSDESVDYPDYVHPVAEAIEKKDYDFGILVCGTGNGSAITANKHQGIRAVICWNEMSHKILNFLIHSVTKF